MLLNLSAFIIFEITSRMDALRGFSGNMSIFYWLGERRTVSLIDVIGETSDRYNSLDFV